MYKVIIADDEPLLRFAVRNLLKWEDYGFSVVGEAGDGMETLKLVRELKPDIIFSDIRMPKMDGLEMVRLLKNESNALVVIMSNYDDFRYAQEALRLGVDDYVLKSALDNETLEKIIETEKLKLDVTKQASFSEEKEESVEKALKAALMLNREKEIEELKKLNNIEILRMPYRVIYLTVLEKDYSHRIERKQMIIYMNFMENILNDRIGKKGYYFPVCDGGFVIVLTNQEFSCLGEIRFWKNVVGLLERYTNRTFIAGVSIVGKAAVDFCDCYEKAAYAADRYFFDEGEKVRIGETTASVRDTKLYELLEDFFEAAGEISWITGMRNVISEMLEEVEKTQLQSDRCKTILINVLTFYEMKLQEGGQEYRKITEKINYAGTYSELKRETNALMEEIGGDAAEKSSYSLLVQQAMQWIKENYTEQITLVMAAEYFSVHPNHLSRIFSQQTGKSFSTYLKDYRMEKAKVFLLNRALSVQEVGEKVGIPNGKYFSDAFKKWCGLSPSEYRMNINPKGEE